MEHDTCAERLKNLEETWDDLKEGRRVYLLHMMVRDNCQEAVPLILRILEESNDPLYRRESLRALGGLGRRDLRQIFVDYHKNDPDDSIRSAALAELGCLFRSERDREILQLALETWDNPSSGEGMRLVAGAMMMYQLGYDHDELGRPAWWDEHNAHELEHPLVLKAVEETRITLSE